MQKLKKVLTADNTAKKPVKVAVKSPYKIIIMVNDNDRFGTHAGMIMVSPTSFQIYDPNGSFTFSGVAGGSLGLFPIDGIDNQKRAFEEYIHFQLEDGKNVFIYKFFVSKKEYEEIEERILTESCGVVLYCSACTSSAIAGIGPFKTIESGIFLPANLKKAMDKIGTPVRMVGSK